MKKFLASITIFAFLLVATAPKVHASHISGMDLTYAYTGTPNTYIVTLKFYRDCAGITPFDATICYSSATCNLSGSITIPLPAPTQIPIPPCIPNPGATTCNGGSAYGIEEYVYSGTVTLPAACTDWVFSYNDCCRNAQISTITGFGSQGIYIAAYLDNLNFPTNSSPVFSNFPVTQFCVLNQFYYDQGASDVDGDSLAFFLVAPQDGGFGCPPGPSNDIIYMPGYADTIPFDSQNGVIIDPLTGVVSFIPSQQQVGVMAVLVREYRNGIEVGHISRDIQINITAACAVNPPVPATFNVQLGGANLNGVGVQCGDSSVILSFSANPVQCKSIEKFGTDFRILAPNGQPNPAISATAINCQGGVTDSILIHFYYPLKYGITYMWTKIGTDNNTLLSECGSPIAENDTVLIILEDTSKFSILTTQNLPCAFDSCTLTFTQPLDCYSFDPNGSDLILYDATGASFNISNVYGIGCNVNNPNSSIFHFDFSSVVNGLSPFYLVSLNGTDSTTIANQCGKFVHPGDTIAILTVTNSLPLNMGPDTTLCSTEPLPIINAGISGGTYLWTLNGSPLTNNTQSLQTTGPGTYMVHVTIGPSCSGSDTIQVFVVAAPQLTLNDLAVCDYDPLPVLDAQNTNASFVWTLNGNPIPGATNQTLQTSGAGTYAVTITAGSCVGTGSMNLTINATDKPGLVDTTICIGSSVTLDALPPNAGDLVFWYSDTNLIANTQTLTIDSTGNYIGIIQTVAGCRGADTSTVVVEELMPAPKVGCGSGSGNLKYVYTWNSIPGATGYQVFVGGQWVTNTNTPDTVYATSQTITDFRVKALNSNSACKEGNVSELAPCEVIIPNIITPNADGVNDVFFIKNLEGHPNSSLKIMNRWGNIVLKDDNYQNNWDGDKLSDGTYFYILKLDDGSEFTGTLTILNGK